MNRSYLEMQFIEAKENYNYFIVKLIISVIRILCKLAVVLLLGCLFDNTILLIIQLFYVFYSFYNVNSVVTYYLDILNDIKETAIEEHDYLEIDLNLLENNLFRRVIK